MTADNLEGQEVDVLIKELSSAPKKPVVAKTAVKPGIAPTTAPPAAPVPVPALFPPPPRVVHTGGSPKPFAMPKVRRSFLPAFNLPSMPSWPAMPPGLSWPSLPRLNRMRASAAALPAPTQPNLVRMCVGLGVLLGTAMEFWPYPKSGVLWLLFYFFSVGMVLVSGIWSARLTWETRLGYAHTIAVAVVLWGMTLVAEETLRYGYVTTEAAGFLP